MIVVVGSLGVPTPFVHLSASQFASICASAVVEGSLCIVTVTRRFGASGERARAVVDGVRVMVVRAARIGASGKERTTGSVVDCGARFVVVVDRVRTTCMHAERRVQTVGRGTGKVIGCLRIHAATHVPNACAQHCVCGVRVVVSRVRYSATIHWNVTRSIVLVGQDSVVERTRVCAPLKDNWAASVVVRCERGVADRSCVHTSTDDAVSRIDDGKGPEVERRRIRASVRRRRRRLRRRRR